MNKTKIEWADYTWNPVTGCLFNCSYCYARKIAERFRGTKAWPNGFEPTVHIGRFDEPIKLRKPCKIFVCSMGELFGDWLNDNSKLTIPDVQLSVLQVVKSCPQHTFQFLTKCPQNLPKFNPWPDNAWVGVTATDNAMYEYAMDCLYKVQANVRFISFEPLLEPMSWRISDIKDVLDWIIIGAQTNPNRLPKREWVQEIIDAADEAGIPVFLKDNLKWDYERKEWPKKGGSNA